MRWPKALDGIQKVIAFERDTLSLSHAEVPFFLNRTLAELPSKVSLGRKGRRLTGSTRDGGHVPATFHHHPNNVTRLAHFPLTPLRCYVLAITQREEEDLGDLLEKGTTN
jgi:hypothetical protein